MGGGAAMRAAAKVAGINLFNNGLRGIVPDHPVSAAARKAARPVTAAFASSSDSAKAVTSVGIDQASVQMPYWEVDEWEFAGGEEDVLSVSSDGMPRLVFGGAPSIDEAKEATSELKDALEKAYLFSSPPSPRLSQLEVLETKACVASETVVAPAAPKHAVQAFRFLNESPAVQSVVASIASDPNVWNAVLLNPALQDYLQSQKLSAPIVNVDQYEKEYTDSDTQSPTSPMSHGGSPGIVESVFGKSTQQLGIVDVWQNLKLRVVDMMNNLSDYFQDLFGGYNGEKDANGNVIAGFVDKALGPSLMGLAVMVIMLVVLKRA